MESLKRIMEFLSAWKEIHKGAEVIYSLGTTDARYELTIEDIESFLSYFETHEAGCKQRKTTALDRVSKEHLAYLIASLTDGDEVHDIQETGLFPDESDAKLAYDIGREFLANERALKG